MANAVVQAGHLYDKMPATVNAGDELVAAAKKGDESAFRGLYRAHRNEVHRVLFRLLGPTDDLEDVIQDVFLQVHKSIKNFKGHAKFSTWLHRVAVNVGLQHLRRKKSTIVSHPDDRVDERPANDEGSTPHEQAEIQDRLRAVYAALDMIAPKKRAVLVMHDMQGLSAHKIAEIVGAPVFTVRTRLFYARREFYKKITNDPAFFGDISATELSRKK